MSSTRIKLKGSVTATDTSLSNRLSEALDSLDWSACTFWACKGPQKPVHQVTCSRCYAVRDINVVMAALRARKKRA